MLQFHLTAGKEIRDWNKSYIAMVQVQAGRPDVARDHTSCGLQTQSQCQAGYCSGSNSKFISRDAVVGRSQILCIEPVPLHLSHTSK